MAVREQLYQRLDDVRIEALARNPSHFSFVLHQDSNAYVSDFSERLKGKGIGYTDFPSEFAPNYSLFASMDPTRIGAMSRSNDRYFSSTSKWKEVFADSLEELGHPGCCLKQMRQDHSSKTNSVTRLGMQMVDLMGSSYLTGKKVYEMMSGAEREPEERTKGVMESKEDWSRVDTSKGEAEVASTNDDDWREISRLNEALYGLKRDSIRRSVLNVKLSRELPMCSPDCEQFFGKYTSKLVDASRSLGYDLKGVSDSSSDFLEKSVGSYWRDGKARNIGELEAIAESGLLRNIKKGSEIQLSAVKDTVMTLRSYEARVISELYTG